MTLLLLLLLLLWVLVMATAALNDAAHGEVDDNQGACTLLHDSDGAVITTVRLVLVGMAVAMTMMTMVMIMMMMMMMMKMIWVLNAYVYPLCALLWLLLVLEIGECNFWGLLKL